MSAEPEGDFASMLAAYDRIINDKALQQELLDAGLLVRVDPTTGADDDTLPVPEWLRLTYTQADIAALKERAIAKDRTALRERVAGLPEALDVALGYSVVARSAVLALLPTQASDSPEKP